MEVQNIRIDLISPSPLNPRKTFDEAALQELASNIEKQGLLQPITVRVAKSEDVTDLETGDVTTIPCSYEIVCGERRFRAVSLLKEKEDKENENESADEKCDAELTNLLMHLKKGDSLTADTYEIKEGETSPPKRYTSGSIILTMENAGQFIEDEELRAQIKGSGIGTSATRAEILKKLVNIEYLALNKKTQVLTPTQMGEMIYDVVSDSIRPLLNPALTASWEKGLTMVADGVITPEEYMGKLTDFVGRRTTAVRSLNNQGVLWRQFQATEEFYQKKTKQSNAKNKE
jgi:DNA topoisomerase-3